MLAANVAILGSGIWVNSGVCQARHIRKAYQLLNTRAIISCKVSILYVIFITCWQVLYEVYKQRARGRGAYKLHIARGGVL